MTPQMGATPDTSWSTPVPGGVGRADGHTGWSSHRPFRCRGRARSNHTHGQRVRLARQPAASGVTATAGGHSANGCSPTAASGLRRVRIVGADSESRGAAWRKALKRAGIENFRWHDLRHTQASRHVQSGTPLHALQTSGRWADYSMVLRYAHPAPEHLAEHAARIETGSSAVAEEGPPHIFRHTDRGGSKKAASFQR
jgi:hypothetical protein